MILLLLLAASSVVWIRRLHGVLFYYVHITLALCALLLLLFHVWLARPAGRSLEAKVPISVAAAIWTLAVLYRRVRVRRARANVTVIQSPSEIASPWQTECPAILDVSLFKTVSIHPGAYFYLFFERSGWRQYRGEPMMAYGWEAASDTTTWRWNSKQIKKLQFLVQNQEHLSAVLSRRDVAVTLDGPYGRDPLLHKFDTVVLVADGIGILAILPLVIHLAERSWYDQSVKMGTSGRGTPEHELLASMYRDRTRQVNVIWLMREAREFNWITERLDDLAKLDSSKVRGIMLRKLSCLLLDDLTTRSRSCTSALSRPMKVPAANKRSQAEYPRVSRSTGRSVTPTEHWRTPCVSTWVITLTRHPVTVLQSVSSPVPAPRAATNTASLRHCQVSRRRELCSSAAPTAHHVHGTRVSASTSRSK